MASTFSSCPLMAACFSCQSPSTELWKGWRLSDGCYAALCNICVSDYVNGTFCEKFHKEAKGWSVCADCEKPIHCGCIMSVQLLEINECGGVHCKDCSMKTAASQFAGTAKRNIDLQKLFFMEDHSNGNAQVSDTGENLPNIFGEKLRQIIKEKNSTVKFLFEKRLSSWDAKSHNKRLIVPKKYAEAYFPAIIEKQQFPINVLDTNGNLHTFRYHCWANNSSNMYVLEGLKGYVKFVKWEIGDIVKFYQIEPEKMMVMEVESFASSQELTHQQAGINSSAKRVYKLGIGAEPIIRPNHS